MIMLSGQAAAAYTHAMRVFKFQRGLGLACWIAGVASTGYGAAGGGGYAFIVAGVIGLGAGGAYIASAYSLKRSIDDAVVSMVAKVLKDGKVKP